jgi:hypothetical protein
VANATETTSSIVREPICVGDEGSSTKDVTGADNKDEIWAAYEAPDNFDLNEEHASVKMYE